MALAPECSVRLRFRSSAHAILPENRNSPEASTARYASDCAAYTSARDAVRPLREEASRILDRGLPISRQSNPDATIPTLRGNSARQTGCARRQATVPAQRPLAHHALLE